MLWSAWCRQRLEQRDFLTRSDCLNPVQDRDGQGKVFPSFFFFFSRHHETHWSRPGRAPSPPHGPGPALGSAVTALLCERGRGAGRGEGGGAEGAPGKGDVPAGLGWVLCVLWCIHHPRFGAFFGYTTDLGGSFVFLLPCGKLLKSSGEFVHRVSRGTRPSVFGIAPLRRLSRHWRVIFYLKFVGGFFSFCLSSSLFFSLLMTGSVCTHFPLELCHFTV